MILRRPRRLPAAALRAPRPPTRQPRTPRRGAVARCVICIRWQCGCDAFDAEITLEPRIVLLFPAMTARHTWSSLDRALRRSVMGQWTRAALDQVLMW